MGYQGMVCSLDMKASVAYDHLLMVEDAWYEQTLVVVQQISDKVLESVHKDLTEARKVKEVREKAVI